MSRIIGFILALAMLVPLAPMQATAAAPAGGKVHEGVNTTMVKGHKFVITVKNHKMVSVTTMSGGKMVAAKTQNRTPGKKFATYSGCWENFYTDYYPYYYLGSVWIC